MLKVTDEAEERRGCVLMAWWDGQGAAPVLAHAPGALLMARAAGARSLAAMAKTGQDDEATRILCGAAKRLHDRRGRPADVVPLDRWFRALDERAGESALLGQAWAEARRLLAEARDGVVLHGDLHHDNVLDFGAAGWLAIDPKGLIGPRGFDFANILCNPEGSALSLAPGRFERQVTVIADATGIAGREAAGWALAYAGLSAAWYLGDGMADKAAGPLGVAALAAAAIG
jgi:streptomycin 6-kinase